MRRKFLYADRREQVKKINKCLVIVYVIFYIFFGWIMIISRLIENRPMLIVSSFVISCALMMILDLVIYKCNRSTEKLRFIAFGGMFLIAVWSQIVFEAPYLRFMTLVPLIISIFYYDTKYTVITAVLMGLLNQGFSIVKGFVIRSFATEAELMNEFCISLVILLFSSVIIIAERAGKRFNEDALGQAEEEKDAQTKMMGDVIEVAKKVRNGTENAMFMLKDLGKSTSTVTDSMRNIARSTQIDAEKIQEQTVMTQNIQKVIEQIVKYSGNMVEAANTSGELNKSTLELVKQLKVQSDAISDKNSDTVKIMEQLQSYANAVKGISDTIFNISSQTNLLALNASIESARAGEAGRGFAVVSNEIRQLAEKTKKETDQIANVLQELSDNAQCAVKAVMQSAEATEKQTRLISHAKVSFEKMNDNVNSLSTDISEIGLMLNDLSDANNQIVENIVHLAATAEEILTSSEQAENLSEQNLTNADKMSSLLNGVICVSEELDKYIVDR